MILICDHIHSLHYMLGLSGSMGQYIQWQCTVQNSASKALQQSAYKGLKTTSDQVFPYATGGLRSRVQGPTSKNLDLRFQVLGPKSHPRF
jgi:hypothetical protein